MAKPAAAKLTRLRSALKKMNSIGKLRRTTSGDSSSSSSSDDNNSLGGGVVAMMTAPPTVTVLVGKCRRRYEIRAEVVEHPVLRQLAAGRSEEGTIIVGCEVVLFEHLLWMLDNAGLDDDQSLDYDLVDLYTCS